VIGNVCARKISLFYANGIFRWKTSSCQLTGYNFRSIYLIVKLGYIGAPSVNSEGKRAVLCGNTERP